MAFNIRSAYPPGYSTTEVDPAFPVITPDQTVADQLRALSAEEGKGIFPYGARRPVRSGLFGSSAPAATRAPVRPVTPDYGQQAMQRKSPADYAEERTRAILADAAGRPVPKKYVNIQGQGAYLVDDWDAVPAAMRPNSQISTAGYTPKAQTSAHDDLIQSLLADYAARQAQAQTGVMEHDANAHMSSPASMIGGQSYKRG